jgi:UDP-N-acetylmuramoylalanine--D-glutamate ligase
MQEQDKVVLELSSFQLMDMNISPSISIVTNVSPNHLNIHRSYEEYIDAKANIFKSQDKNGIVVLN